MQFAKFQTNSKSATSIGTLKTLLAATDKVEVIINKKDITKSPMVGINIKSTDPRAVVVSKKLAPLVRSGQLTVKHLVWLPVLQATSNNGEPMLVITLPTNTEVSMEDIEEMDLTGFAAA